jgi:ankyrin
VSHIASLECGVDGNVHDMYETILLHSASYQGKRESVGTLLDHGVKMNAKNHWGETVLHVASRGRQDSQSGVHVARLLLERGMDVNTRREGNFTPLHVSSCFGKLEIVRLLLDHGAEANAETEGGMKLLHQVSFGQYESQEDGVRVAELLLEHGAEVDTRTKDHCTPLHLASYFGNIEIVRLLLNHGADPEAAEGNMGDKPLHRVACGEYKSQEDGVRVAQLLLERGADVNTQRRDHQTPLHLASYYGNIEIVCLLLDHGADLEAADGNVGGKPLHHVPCGEYKSQEDGVRVAQLLLERGADVNTRCDDHQTPLHLASYFGNIEIVRLLLNHGADPEAAEGDMGEKPLHRVARGEYKSQEDGVRVAQLLLDRGADINTRRKDDWTPLHLASYLGNIEIVRLLLNHGADPEAAEGDMGEKPLHRVARGEYKSQEDGVRVAQLLLDRGADINTRRKDDWTPLHLASYFGNIEIVRLLLNHGADPEAAEGDMGDKPLHRVACGEYKSQEDGVRVAQLLLERGADVNTQRRDHQTPLHLASYYGNIEIVCLLLDHGADLEAADGNVGGKPLHHVPCGEYKSQEDGVRVAQLLLERGADVNTRCDDHQTPLHLASYFGNIEIVRLLLNHGADPEAAEGNMGEKPLHRVARGEYKSQEDGVRVAQLLLERGANVNTQRKDHQTPLHLASYFGNIEIVRLLLNHGADPEAAEGNMGDKPLHRVACGEYKSQEDGVRVAQLLLDRGADINTRRKDDWTPLHLASYFGNAEIVQLLIDHGAEVDVMDDFGKTPLHDVSNGKYESQEDGVRVARLLLDHGAGVNAKSKSGDTPLELASITGRLMLAELFIEHAANVNAPRLSAKSKANMSLINW